MPKKSISKKSAADQRTHTTMRLSVQLMKDLQKLAAAEHRSRANLVECILQDHVNNKLPKRRTAVTALAANVFD